MALVHAPTDRILLGRRLTAPSKGMWAFPGGQIEPGESIEQAALRELEEETGIHFDPGREAELVTEVFVTGRHGGVYQITNLLWTTATAPPPEASHELEAAWIPLSEIANLRPLVPGVSRVLRRWRTAKV